MKTNLIEPKLGAVQETLLLPLIGRADISRRNDGFFEDKKAEEITESLNFGKKQARRYMGEAGLLGMAVRAIKMDKAIKDFISRNPDAVILNIGAGLDTAFWRVDNGRIKWIDLDLPDSMELRKQFLPESDRNRHLERSMFDYGWIDEIGDISKGLFIQVPGVLPYIPEPQVRDFFTEVPARLSGAEMIFDVVNDWGKWMITFGIRRMGMKDASLKWGITDANKIVRWNKNVRIIRQEPFFNDIPRKWTYRPSTNILMELNDISKVAQLFHLQFV